MTVANGALSRMTPPINKVAVVRASRIGDFMCAVPTLRALRQALPEAEITLIALSFGAEMVRRFPYLDRFAEFPGYPGMREVRVDTARVVAFLAEQQRYRYDLAIQLHGSGAFSNPFTILLGARHTAGFSRPEDQGMGLDYWVNYPSIGHEVHRVRLMAQLLGAPNAGDYLEFPLLDEERSQTTLLLKNIGIDPQQPLIGIHPGAKNPTRRWPSLRFATAALQLASKLDAAILITGGYGEEQECATASQALGSHAHNLCGKTSIGILAALMQHMKLFLTNDTGPAHIAYALRVPSVTIFGAAEPEVWGPLDCTRHSAIWQPTPCRPCGLEICQKGYQCLTAISAEHIVNAATTLLG